MELGAILDVLAEEAFEDGEESVEQPGENVRELEQGREIPGVVDKVNVPEPDGKPPERKLPARRETMMFMVMKTVSYQGTAAPRCRAPYINIGRVR